MLKLQQVLLPLLLLLLVVVLLLLRLFLAPLLTSLALHCPTGQTLAIQASYFMTQVYFAPVVGLSEKISYIKRWWVTDSQKAINLLPT